MRSVLQIGLIFETFETYPPRAGDPVDAHVEFEPESTIEALEAAIESLGHRPRRLGSPRELLAAVAGQGLAGVDVAFNLAEGFSGRNREAWAPVLLEMAGIPTIGSDALSLSLSLDKAWANRWVQAAGVPVAAADDLRGGRRGAHDRSAGGFSALREAALGRHRQGDSAQLSRRDARGAGRGRSSGS